MVDETQGVRVTPLMDANYQVLNTRVSANFSGSLDQFGSNWFGPQRPLAPIAPPEVAGRGWDYPPGYNLVTRPRAYETIGFEQLIALADAYDMIRILIETRKDQMARLEWNIRPRDEKKRKDTSSDSRIKTIEKFFFRPDGLNLWDDWLRQLLEQMFVIDAATCWKERTRGGKLAYLHPIDGSTIKVVIDNWGRTPRPPNPAYQQVLHGLPAVDYTTDDILYKPRNVRTDRVYGYSPVEQIMMTVNIGLRRQISQLQFYTAGNVPESVIKVPESWTPQQIEDYQKVWDSMLSGNTAMRRTVRFVPGGKGNSFVNIKPDVDKTLFDEWIARIACFAFNISPQAFVERMNRATAETAHDQALEEGLAPVMLWVRNLVNDVIEKEFNAPDLEFSFRDDVEPDPAQQATQLTVYVKEGIKTRNEARATLGDDPLPGGDVLTVDTPNGPMPVDIDEQLDQAKQKADAFPQLAEQGGGKDESQSSEEPSQSPPGKKVTTTKSTFSQGASATSGLTAYDLEGSKRPAKPTPAQAAAGNYLKMHATVHGMDVTIENLKGSTRSGVGEDGTEWSVTMPAHYGYIRGTDGMDGDQIDVYLGPEPTSEHVWIVDQRNPDTYAPDEHKVMLGFPDQKEALDTYRAGFSDGRGEERIGGVAYMTIQQFKDWLKNGSTDNHVTGVQEVGKVADVPFFAKGTRILQPIPHGRPLVTRAIVRLGRALRPKMRELAKSVVDQIAARWDSVSKTADDKRKADELVAALNLEQLDEFVGIVNDELEPVATDSAYQALVQIGAADREELVDQVNSRAVTFARNRAAELVGKRYTKSGKLVDNPDARYSIDQSTRDMLRDTIATGLQEKWGKEEIKRQIMAADTEAFSDQRAETIARTEIRRANSQGALEGYKGAKSVGVAVKKAWSTAGDEAVDEEICAPNEEQGPIDLDDDFESGDDSPPGHPNCRCSLVPVVEEGEE